MRIIQFIMGAVLSSAATSGIAQGIIASGGIVGSASGPNYDYSLTITEGSSATGDIGSFWYAWTPGHFYLPATPMSAFAPAGWTANIDGDSIQFTANNSSFYISPGSTLSGFGFVTSSTPSQLAGNDGSTPVGTTVAYETGLLTTPSDTFVFTTSVVPEPSALVLMGAGALGVFLRRPRIPRS